MAGLQVWSFQAGLAFPEESNLGSVVPRRRELGVLPKASNARVVLEVLPHARKMLHEIERYVRNQYAIEVLGAQVEVVTPDDG